MSEDKEDCPEIIFKTAKTPWQKEVAIEFIRVHKELLKLRSETKWIKWLVIALFGAIVLSKFIGG